MRRAVDTACLLRTCWTFDLLWRHKASQVHESSTHVAAWILLKVLCVSLGYRGKAGCWTCQSFHERLNDTLIPSTLPYQMLHNPSILPILRPLHQDYFVLFTTPSHPHQATFSSPRDRRCMRTVDQHRICPRRLVARLPCRSQMRTSVARTSPLMHRRRALQWYKRCAPNVGETFHRPHAMATASYSSADTAPTCMCSPLQRSTATRSRLCVCVQCRL